MKIICLILIFFSFEILAKPVIREDRGMELDWSRFKIRFHAEAIYNPAHSAETQTFKALQEKAITDALLKVQKYVEISHEEELKRLHLEDSQIKSSSSKASQLVGNTSYIFHTQIFKNQGVEIFLENSLSKVFGYTEHGTTSFPAPSNHGLLTETKGDSIFSGVILRSASFVEPRAHYEIVDETGKILFSQKDIKKEAYLQNLMGRWLEAPSRQEVSALIGVKTVSIEFKEDSKKRFMVQGKVWNQFFSESKDLLTQAKIVLAVNQPSEDISL